MVVECVARLTALAANNRVFLLPVPGQKDIKGNEVVDIVFRKVAAQIQIDPYSFPIPQHYTGREEIPIGEQHWNRVSGQRQAKKLLR